MNLSKLTILFLLVISASSVCGMTESTDSAINLTQAEQVDSLTITVFVSFTVDRNGKISRPKIEKIECAEYEIKELDKKAIKKTKNEALRVIEEMNDLDPIEKPSRYTQPIKMRLPADEFLKSK
jgi:hypothetical protein